MGNYHRWRLDALRMKNSLYLQTASCIAAGERFAEYIIDYSIRRVIKVRNGKARGVFFFFSFFALLFSFVWRGSESWSKYLDLWNIGADNPGWYREILPRLKMAID